MKMVEESDELIRACSDVGRFLEEDYRRAINDSEFSSGELHNSILRRDQMQKTWAPTRIVIVGARSVPLVTARAVSLAGQNKCCQSIHVKCPSLDEELLVRSMWGDNQFLQPPLSTFVFDSGGEAPQEWLDAVEDASHIVVYGSSETVEHFNLNKKPWQKVIGFGSKFSIGIAKIEGLSARAVVDDFVQYYGSGCLSPRRYYLMGSEGQYNDFLDEMGEEYNSREDQLVRYWTKNKMPMLGVRTKNVLQSGYRDIHRSLLEEDFSDDLNGTADVCRVDLTYRLLEGLTGTRGLISTIATNSSSLQYAHDFSSVVRFCQPGEMQSPRIMWTHDGEDELTVTSTRREMSI